MHTCSHACTRTRARAHTQEEEEEEEEEEMRSSGRAHPLTIPMVPAGPHRLGALVVGVLTLRLSFVSCPWSPAPT